MWTKGSRCRDKPIMCSGSRRWRTDVMRSQMQSWDIPEHLDAVAGGMKRRSSRQTGMISRKSVCRTWFLFEWRSSETSCSLVCCLWKRNLQKICGTKLQTYREQNPEWTVRILTSGCVGWNRNLYHLGMSKEDRQLVWELGSANLNFNAIFLCLVFDNHLLKIQECSFMVDFLSQLDNTIPAIIRHSTSASIALLSLDWICNVKFLLKNCSVYFFLNSQSNDQSSRMGLCPNKSCFNKTDFI